MALILTRRGGLSSLIAAMLGVPMCEIASHMSAYNPYWALVVGCVAGLAAWGLFILPMERSAVGAPARV